MREIQKKISGPVRKKSQNDRSKPACCIIKNLAGFCPQFLGKPLNPCNFPGGIHDEPLKPHVSLLSQSDQVQDGRLAALGRPTV